jgi:hypothetical protein
MALRPSGPGLEVQIVAADLPLLEHEDRTSKVSKNAVESYVEAQSNTHFEIWYPFRPPFPAGRAVSMIITIDGEDVEKTPIRPFEFFRRGVTCELRSD